MTLDWSRLGVIFGLGIAIGLVASFVPIRRVSRLDLLDALAAN